MSLDDFAKNAVAAVEESDKKALASRAAFAAGKFEAYWEQQGREAQARLEAMYAVAMGTQTAGGGVRGADSGNAPAPDGSSDGGGA